MKTVKLTMGWPDPVSRQTPGASGRWGDLQFVVDDENLTECDYWVVYDDPKRPEKVHCRSGHSILITQEPPSIRGYSEKFLEQFTCVLTFRRDLNHPNIHLAPPPVPWYVGTDRSESTISGTSGYDLLKSHQWNKTRSLSVICSAKAMTDGHRRRLAFVEKLKSHFDNRIDVYGSGFEPILDKWDVIEPYKYHLSIENSRHPDYWTEKVADTFLSGAMLLYDGCPNLEDYFPRQAFCRVDRDDVSRSIDVIEALLADDPYDRVRPHIERSRQLVLEKYNIFPMLSDLIRQLPPRAAETVRICEEETFSATPLELIGRRVKQALLKP
jgi:Glycosyltransferase family 10 (fucosyltransferase) C-term